ncbi:protein of unassigned function [Methylobacterium oryzae CBMB20]|uniref:Protein of unassigned function n=1 Tax=Methylobacterium oryzae CBMB20 TaxID=693986 RepID=A0A089Q4U7_9HYPH|nr:protein of unassigned function [Methylobacterium oryzae CBMB20]
MLQGDPRGQAHNPDRIFDDRDRKVAVRANPRVAAFDQILGFFECSIDRRLTGP